ncbi:hypothetical protein CO695_17745 [Providencia alcalifaciens]|uniref:Uncharacterized protein n=1 Tax=Providencia alcalifaciens DSM 30120 TaxID=520999 RepID=B6XBQ1_9GAMM|nr:hypothetical protein [Providencia alcalifaciens]ATG18054.1 hypothetical protein CO695_17745 [Providencia alcalifaciens]EEB47053.1 hypothetical protein PROVALCAL_00762 [Providencia alcalifaciens DSM 30120]SQI33490.1 Uncharacterised protein [Providencia alcalifaciens]
MTDYMYRQGIDLIKAMRGYDNFTVKMLVSGCAISPHSAPRLLEVMSELGCVKFIGKFNRNSKGAIANHYRVTPYAVTKLKKAKSECDRKKLDKYVAKKTKVQSVANHSVEVSKKKKQDSLGEMIVVKKACVDGLGSSLLMHLDKLLAGVRA